MRWSRLVCRSVCRLRRKRGHTFPLSGNARTREPGFIASCHCLDCKRASGGEAATYLGVPENDFALISGKPRAFHYIAESGKGLDRVFYPDCGSRVYSAKVESFPALVFVQIGTLDQPGSFAPPRGTLPNYCLAGIRDQKFTQNARLTMALRRATCDRREDAVPISPANHARPIRPHERSRPRWLPEA